MPSSRKLLVIEDDADLRDVLKDLLSEHYTVLTAGDGIEGFDVAKQARPDLILLDVMMPKRNGLETVGCLRSDLTTQDIPVLMLTAAADLPLRIKAFRMGADDFMPKPFEPEELLLRLAAKIRLLESVRTKKRSRVLECGNLSMNLDNLEVRVGERSIQLSLLEFNLVKYLVRHFNKLRTRKQIVAAVWDSEGVTERILDPHIMTIRRKLAGFDHEIASVYGGGYILRAPSLKTKVTQVK